MASVLRSTEIHPDEFRFVLPSSLIIFSALGLPIQSESTKASNCSPATAPVAPKRPPPPINGAPGPPPIDERGPPQLMKGHHTRGVRKVTTAKAAVTQHLPCATAAGFSPVPSLTPRPHVQRDLAGSLSRLSCTQKNVPFQENHCLGRQPVPQRAVLCRRLRVG